MKKFLSVSLACLLVVLSFSLFGCGEKVEPKLTLSKNEITMDINEVQSLGVKLENISEPNLTWASSNTSVVEVESGVLTAKGSGSAEVSVSTNGLTAKCSVTVTSGIMIYQNTDGDYSDWNGATEATGLTKTTLNGEQVAAITKNGKELNNDPVVSTYKTDEYNFVIRYDIYLVASQLTGVKGSNIASVDVGLRVADGEEGASWADYRPTYGAASGNTIKAKDRCDDLTDVTGNFEVEGSKWYTVEITVTSTEEGAKTIVGKVFDRATHTLVEGSQSTYQVANTTAEYIYANIYYPGTENSSAVAYIDNFAIVATLKAAE